MKISAIMPCKNEEKYLEATLDSLLLQTRMPDELIFNSCSTDRSDEIMLAYKDRFEALGCKVVMQHVVDGLGRFNDAVATSTGDALSCCCANDIYEPDFFNHLEKCLLDNPDVDIAYMWWKESNDAGEHLYDFRAPDDYLPYLKALGNCIAGHSLYTRKMHDDAGGIIDHAVTKQAEDYNLWLRAIAKGYKAKLVPEFLLNWRRHAGQASSFI